MFTKLLLAAGALALAGLPAASAASFEVWFGTPVQAGAVELPPGPYSVHQHRCDEASFRNLNTGQIYTTPATVERLAVKNPSTVVQIQTVDGQQQVQMITLGGHAADLTFGG
ncbi:MAG TPA: hypothetical protein VMB85_04130 [Bryobacteraceae bacterium]|jgi:hypothetical protein|nr:hypothetical protein [Bryobacteraceae bacterium]